MDQALAVSSTPLQRLAALPAHRADTAGVVTIGTCGDALRAPTACSELGTSGAGKGGVEVTAAHPAAATGGGVVGDFDNRLSACDADAATMAVGGEQCTGVRGAASTWLQGDDHGEGSDRGGSKRVGGSSTRTVPAGTLAGAGGAEKEP